MRFFASPPVSAGFVSAGFVGGFVSAGFVGGFVSAGFVSAGFSAAGAGSLAFLHLPFRFLFIFHSHLS